MTAATHDFLGYDELPIPEDVRAGGPGWTERMLEMAEHLGAYRTLQLVDRFGGMRIYIPRDPERGKSYGRRGSIVDLIGIGAAAKLSAVYGSEYFDFPVGRAAVHRAKRAPVLAAVREGRLSRAEAAAMLGMQRTYLSKMLNDLGEGLGAGAERAEPSRRDPRQIDLFGDE